MTSPSPLAGEGLGRGPAASPSREELRKRAKSMRTAPTDAEQRLWQLLRAHRLAGYKFKRQQTIDHYIVDFVCLRYRLIVEADGGQHSKTVDARRDAYLKAQAFRVLRFWNNDILDNEEGVLESILDALRNPSPPPSPARGEGVLTASSKNA
jgi:very-short-patch-repair endonuclease